MCSSAYLLNNNLWSYSKLGKNAAANAGKKAIKGGVGKAMSVFFVCANPLNPDESGTIGKESLQDV